MGSKPRLAAPLLVVSAVAAAVALGAADARAQAVDPQLAAPPVEQIDAEPDGDDADQSEDADRADEVGPDPFGAIEESEEEAQSRRRRRAAEQPLRQMTQEQLQSEGFVFGDEGGRAVSSTATMIALTAGLSVHGLGHIYGGDEPTGYFLLAMEGLSAGLMLSSALYYAVSDGSEVWTAVAAPVFQIGLGSFAYGWVLDVLGTVQGPKLRVARNTHPLTGLGLRASYGFIGGAESVPIRHVIDAGLSLDLGGFYVDAATTQDVLLNGSRYLATVGGRPLAASRRLTHLYVEGNGEYLRFDEVGSFERLEAEGRVGVSFDLGTLFTHLDEVVAGLDAGYGHRWYRFPSPPVVSGESVGGESDGEGSFVADGGYIPARFFGHFNVTEGLNLWLSYGSPESPFVPVPHRLFGNAVARLRYRSSDLGDITMGLEVGDGVALSIGGELWWWR